MTLLTRIEVIYRVTTPCFCGGADGRHAEFRLPSFKGVLRFWWRALAWSRFTGDLAAIKKCEDRLFGSAAGGRSRVSMSLASTAVLPAASTELAMTFRGRQGVRYLGYGIEEGERTYLPAPFDVTFRLAYRPTTGLGQDRADEECESLVEALTLVGLLGGLGFKSQGHEVKGLRRVSTGLWPRHRL
jgi:CRISPR-associated protein Cmr1